MASGKKLSLKDAKELAKTFSGQCLSNEYVNNNTKMLWQCSEGHKFEARYREVQSGQWCRYCSKGQLTYEEFGELVDTMEGEIVSCDYKNRDSLVKLRCNEGHEWETKVGNILRGYWCPRCAFTGPRTLEDMQNYAESKGGKCLSTEYLGYYEKLKWECKRGHKWLATPHIFASNKWCPKCARVQRLTLKEMQKIAKAKGGKCLSTEYINARSKLEWQCSAGHIWQATPDKIKNNGQWCRECWIESMRGEKISAK